LKLEPCLSAGFLHCEGLKYKQRLSVVVKELIASIRYWLIIFVIEIIRYRKNKNTLF